MSNNSHHHLELNALFNQLQQSLPEEAYAAIEQKIITIWQQNTCEGSTEQLKLAHQTLNQKKYKITLKTLSQLHLLNPQFLEVLYLRALVYHRRGEFKNALKSLDKLITQEPRHFPALSLQASMLMLIGDYRKALTTFESLADIYPQRQSLSDKIKQLKANLHLS